MEIINNTKTHKKLVLWLTGLSGSGKSSLAEVVVRRLRDQGHAVVLLDGDALREVFYDDISQDLAYNRRHRLMLAMKYARLCRMLVEQGLIVVIATISLFKEVHSWNRINLPGYFEVYLKVPLEELRLRDTKGIYRRFDSGELTYVAGLDVAIDEPVNADWAPVFLHARSVEILADELFGVLKIKEIL